MDQALFNSHRIQRNEFHLFLMSLKKFKALVQGHKASKCQSGIQTLGQL